MAPFWWKKEDVKPSIIVRGATEKSLQRSNSDSRTQPYLPIDAYKPRILHPNVQRPLIPRLDKTARSTARHVSSSEGRTRRHGSDMSLLQHTDNVEDRWEQILPIMYSQTDAFDGLESPIELEAPSLALNMQEQSTSIHELKESASVTDLTDVRKKIADKLDETELRLCLESECAYSRFQELPRGISQNEEQCQETLLIHESIPENFRSSTSVVDLTDLRKKILNKLDETDIRIYLDSESQLFRYSVFQDNENYMLDSDVQYQETLGSRESLDSQTMVLEEFSVGTMIESLATFQEFPEEINRATLVPSSLENTQYLVEPKSEDAPINQDEDVGEALTLEAEVGTPSGPQNFSEHSLILTHERELQGHLDGQLSTERQWQDAPSEQTVVRELPQCHSNSESQSEDISTHQSIPSNYRIVQETLNFGEYSECEPKSALQHIANPSHFAAEDEENEEIPETGHQINENIAIFEELSSSSSEGNVNEGARLHQEYGSTLGKSNDALQPDTTPESLNAVQMLILRQIPEGTLCLAASPQNQLSQHYSRFTQPELSEKMPSVMMQNSQYLEEPNWESTDPAFSQLEEAISTNSTQDSLSVQDTHEIPNSQVGSTAELLTYSISSLSLSEDEDVSLAEIPMIQYEEANQRIGVLIRQGSLQEVLLSAGSDAEILYPLQSSSSSSEVDLAPVNEVQMNSEDVSSASMLNSQPSRIHPGSVSRLEVLPADAEPLENTGHLEIVSYRLPQECHITDKEVRQPQFEVSNLTVSPSLTHQDVSQGEEVTPLSAAAGNESEDDPPLRRRQNSETDSPLGNEIALTVLQSRYLEDLGRQLAQRAAERVDSFKDIEYVHENITRPQIVNWFDGITAQRAEEYARYHEKPCILKLKDAQVECWGSSRSSNEKYFQISSHDILSSTQTGQTGKLTLFFVQKQGDRKAKLRLLTLYVSSSLAAAKWASEINALAWRNRLSNLMRKKMLLLVSKRRVETSVLVADYIEPVLLCAGKNYTKILTDEVNVSEALAGLDLKEFDCISFLSFDKSSLVIPAIKTAVQSAVGYTHLIHQLVESDEPQDVVHCALHLLKDVKEGSTISISATLIKRDKYTLASIANNVSRKISVAQNSTISSAKALMDNLRASARRDTKTKIAPVMIKEPTQKDFTQVLREADVSPSASATTPSLPSTTPIHQALAQNDTPVGSDPGHSIAKTPKKFYFGFQ